MPGEYEKKIGVKRVGLTTIVFYEQSDTHNPEDLGLLSIKPSGMYRELDFPSGKPLLTGTELQEIGMLLFNLGTEYRRDDD